MYCVAMPYTDENVYETAAYKFGGRIDEKIFPSLNDFKGNKILSPNKGWYK